MSEVFSQINIVKIVILLSNVVGPAGNTIPLDEFVARLCKQQFIEDISTEDEAGLAEHLTILRSQLESPKGIAEDRIRSAAVAIAKHKLERIKPEDDHNVTIRTLNQVQQIFCLRPSKLERFELSRTDDMDRHQALISTTMTDLGLVAEIVPTERKFDIAIVPGALLARVKTRTHFLHDLEQKHGFTFKKAFFLGGSRPLITSEIGTLEEEFPTTNKLATACAAVSPEHPSQTEFTMFTTVASEIFSIKEQDVNFQILDESDATSPPRTRQTVFATTEDERFTFVNSSDLSMGADKASTRPTTESTMKDCLRYLTKYASKEEHRKVLIVLSQPHAAQQRLVAETVFPREHYELHFAAAAMAEAPNPLNLLDNLARTTYQHKKLMRHTPQPPAIFSSVQTAPPISPEGNIERQAAPATTEGPISDPPHP